MLQLKPFERREHQALPLRQAPAHQQLRMLRLMRLLMLLLKENSGAGVKARQGKSAGTNNREIKENEDRLAVKKLRRHGKYSVRFKPKETC